MKKILTITKKDDINLDAEVFIIGNEKFATRISKSFNNNQIEELSTKIHNNKKEVFINCNRMIHETMLDDLTIFLDFLKKINFDCSSFSDMGVYNLAKKINIESKLIYNPDTLITNEYDFNYGFELGIKGCFISPFISLENVKRIIRNKKIECYYIGFGYLNIFHSKRYLLTTYKEYKAIDIDTNLKYSLKEEIRDERYPYFEDLAGTHMFTPYIFNAIDKDLNLDGMVFDFILNENLIDNFDDIKKGIIEIDTSDGFLNKEIVYKKVK